MELQTDELEEGRGAVLTHVGSVQDRNCRRGGSRQRRRWLSGCSVVIRKRLTSCRIGAADHRKCVDVPLKQITPMPSLADQRRITVNLISVLSYPNAGLDQRLL